MPRIDAEEWRRLEPHLDQALSLSAEQRADWLQAVAARDPALAAQLKTLLAEQGAAEQKGFLGADLATALPGAAGLARSEAAPPRFAVGERLAGRYQVVRFIARGGMGEVYECHDVELAQRVALKILLPHTAGDPVALTRLKREIALARQVTHPNVCRLFDVGFHPAEPPVAFITMELLEGETLEERLVREGPLLPAAARPLIEPLASGLHAAHQAGVIHRDFKSQNVMLVGPRVVITDFGLARAAAPDTEDARVSRTGAILGSPAYMAPEQVQGEAVTPATDLYALGVVMFEMVTGTLPFLGETALSTALARLERPPPSPGERVPELPASWDAAIRRCLARRPEDRFASAVEVVAALDRPPERRRRWLAVSAVALVPALVLLALAGARLRARAPGAGAGHPRRSVAVVAVRNAAGRADLAWLQSALPEMLTAELAAGEQLRTVAGEAVARMRLELGLPDADSFSSDTLSRIRANLGVDVVVAGSYVALGTGDDGQLRLDLHAQDSAAGAVLGTASAAGTQRQLFELVNSAAAELRGRLGLSASAGEPGVLRAVMPSDREAARLYGEALAHVRAFEYAQARPLLETLVKAAPGFALGHSLLAEVYQTLNDVRNGRAEAQRAVDTSAGLPREQKLLVEARQAWGQGDYKRAAQIYGSLATFFPDELYYGQMLARAQIRAYQRKEALATIEALRRQPGPARSEPMIDLIEARAASKLGDRKRWQAAAARASEKARARGALFALAQAQMEEGEAWQNLGDPGRAAACYQTARGIFERFSDRSGLAATRVELGKLQVEAGQFAEADRLYQQALESYRALDDVYHLARTTDLIGVAAFAQGDLRVARARWEEAIALWPRAGDTEGVAWGKSGLGLLLAEQGDLPAAEKNIDEALALHRQIGMRAGEAEALLHQALVRYLKGDLPAAEQALAAPLALNRELADQAQLARTLLLAGSVARARGQPEEARRRYQEARAAGERIGPVPAAQAQLGLAELDLDRGRAVQAAEAAEAAAEALARAHALDEEAGARELAARALLARGDRAAAAPLVESAQARARITQRPAVRARCAIAAARLAAAQGPTGPAVAGLRKLLADPAVKALPGLTLEVRLAAAELARDRVELARIAAAAEPRGYQLIAARARRPAPP